MNDYIDALLENVYVVAISLLLGGIVLVFIDRFFDDEWIAKLLFLTDVFCHVNQLNSSIQEKEKLFFDVLEKFTYTPELILDFYQMIP